MTYLAVQYETDAPKKKKCIDQKKPLSWHEILEKGAKGKIDISNTCKVKASKHILQKINFKI